MGIATSAFRFDFRPVTTSMATVAVLECMGTSRHITLPARAIIGRAGSCVIVLDDPLISHEHARISCNERGWEIHDLGSRNGTFVDGRKLDTGATAALERGSKIAFGDPRKPWKVSDTRPPEACARDCVTNALHFARDGILTLPPDPRGDDLDSGSYQLPVAPAPTSMHGHAHGMPAGAVGHAGHHDLGNGHPPNEPGYYGADGFAGDGSGPYRVAMHQPLITIFSDPRGQWIAEVDGEPRGVADGSVIAEAGFAWHLHLPHPLEHTHEYALGRAFLGMIDLHLRVAAGRDFVELVATQDDRVIVRRSRAFNHLLLALAQARLQRPIVPGHPPHPDPEGWISVDDLCSALSIDENRLAVDIHRARREFAAASVVNAPNIIERRRATRQLRLGTTRINIQNL